MRNAEFLVQVGAQGQRLRSDLYLCGAQRVGGLQGMAALDALPTTRAMSDLNIEAPHNRLLDDVFLKLRPRFVIQRREVSMSPENGNKMRFDKWLPDALDRWNERDRARVTEIGAEQDECK